MARAFNLNGGNRTWSRLPRRYFSDPPLVWDKATARVSRHGAFFLGGGLRRSAGGMPLLATPRNGGPFHFSATLRGGLRTRPPAGQGRGQVSAGGDPASGATNLALGFIARKIYPRFTVWGMPEVSGA